MNLRKHLVIFCLAVFVPLAAGCSAQSASSAGGRTSVKNEVSSDPTSSAVSTVQSSTTNSTVSAVAGSVQSAAPGNDKQQKAALTQVITALFNGPNPAYLTNGTVLGAGVSKATPSTASTPQTALQTFFTQDAYDTFHANYLSLYHGFAQDSGQTMQAKSSEIKIQKTDSGYSFTAPVSYGKAGKQKQAAVTGTAQFNDAGLLCYFTVASDSGLMKALQAVS